MANAEQLAADVKQYFASNIENLIFEYNEVTIEVTPKRLLTVCRALRDVEPFSFDQLIDVCGVDYLDYGKSEWGTAEATSTGFSRGVKGADEQSASTWEQPRFAVVYHLLSVAKNHRIRIRCFVDPDTMLVSSVIKVWQSADWFEREAFDLFGIIFEGHPDLRRILTDYGFVGHPFRKDFPLIGEVEMRYDAAEGRCIYEPVSIEPRTLVPKVIRDEAFVSQENSDD